MPRPPIPSAPGVPVPGAPLAGAGGYGTALRRRPRRLRTPAPEPGPGGPAIPPAAAPATPVTSLTAATTAVRRGPEGAPEPRPAPGSGCPVTGVGAATLPAVPVGPVPPPSVPPVDPVEAEEFVRHFHAETPGSGDAEARVDAVLAEIAATGTYVHTGAELAFGTQVAWRNAARCIGRLYWRSLHLRDRRHLTTADDVAAECVAHLRESTRRGRIRSTITVFAPDTPAAPGPRIVNDQLVRYAGHRTADGVLGDPRHVGLTDASRALGWAPPTPPGRFDVLPLLVVGGGEHAGNGPRWYDVPADAVLEVGLSHPDHDWFADLGLRWHAVPAIANMHLVIGGVSYPAAPFNGWYMSTEIGARNLADGDRYDLLREVATAMGLDTARDRTMWRDRAAVELTLAVQHSFDAAGVSMADHHGESQRFLRHLEREETAGRSCPVDWTWIVPPISGGLTPVFHRYYDAPTDTGPRFVARPS